MNPEELLSSRIGILNVWSKERIEFLDGNYEMNRISDLIFKKEYLVTSVALEIKNKSKLEKLFFIIVDTTSKLQDHFHDIEKYSIELYNKFNQDSYKC